MRKNQTRVLKKVRPAYGPTGISAHVNYNAVGLAIRGIIREAGCMVLGALGAGIVAAVLMIAGIL